MEYLFANMVQSVISVFFKGGVEEFDKEGRITIIPYPAKEVVIYHPDLKEDVIKRLKALEKNKGMNTVHIMTEKNFSEFDDNKVREINLELNEKLQRLDPIANLMFAPKSNLIVVTLLNVKGEDNSVLNLVFGCLRNIEGLSLAYVITKESVYRVVPDKSSKQIPKIEENHEHGVITQDDITNLIIDLEKSNSSEDLLK